MPRPEDTGFPGIMHGGLLALLLDEAMGWAMRSPWPTIDKDVGGEIEVRQFFELEDFVQGRKN